MGVRRKKKVVDEYSIQRAINKNLITNPKYTIDNLYVYKWESDCLIITKSYYAYEVEIKISKSDYFKDFEKKEKHQFLSLSNFTNKPNYFYYACPSGMIDKSDIPSYAGLIYVNGWNMTIVKRAPLLHKEKFDIDKYHLTDKFYYNMINSKRNLHMIKDRNTDNDFNNGIQAMAKSAIASYKSCCKWLVGKYCANPDVVNKFETRCLMQCDKGRDFVKEIESRMDILKI